MNSRTLTAAACFAICSATTGSAATFDYSYTFDDATVVSGSVEGTLQADGNTESIDSIGSLFVDDSLFFTPLDFSEEITGEPANFVLDGVGLNLGWVSLLDIDAAFFIADFSTETITVGASIVSNTNTFDPNNWIATEQVSAVPLPAGGMLLLSAFGGVAALKRRKKRAAL